MPTEEVKRKPFLENLSLRPRLIFTYLASILIPLLVFGGILYVMSLYEFEHEMRRVSMQSVKQVNTALNEYINQIDTLSLMSYTYDEIEDYLLDTTETLVYHKVLRPEISGPLLPRKRDVSSAKEKTQDFLQNIMGVNQNIDFMSVVSLNGGIITKSKYGLVKTQYDFFTDSSYEKLRNSKGEKVLLPIHKADYLFAPRKNVFSLGRRIFNFEEGLYTGYILIDCDTKVFDHICQDVTIGISGFICIVDEDGNLLYQSGEISGVKINELSQKIGDRQSVDAIENFGSQKTILVSDRSKYTGYTVIGILPYEEVVERVSEIKTVFFTLSVICFLLVFGFSIVISRSVTWPMRNLQNAMIKFERGNTDAKVSVHGYKEVFELSSSFNHLMEKINSLLASIKSIEIKKHEAELETLKSQINPHFLYNTLESIRMMAVIDDNKEIADATEALGNLFRYSVRQRKDIVDVRFEIQHAMNYILLQKIRYGDKFEVAYEIDEEVMNCKMLKFTLQPIIENAIYHGLEKKKGKGRLKLSAYIMNNNLNFEIQDDGVGISPEQLTVLRDYIVSEVDDSTKSIGLKNVNERITLYFGKSYGITIDSSRGTGTAVKLIIPAFYSEDWVMDDVKGISGR